MWNGREMMEYNLFNYPSVFYLLSHKYKEFHPKSRSGVLNTEEVQYSENTARVRSKPRITPQPIPKIELISCCPVGSDSDIKLNRTDTTIDLSHGGREGMNRSSILALIYPSTAANYNGLTFCSFPSLHSPVIFLLT